MSEEQASKFGFNNLELLIGKDAWVDADERIFLATFAILGQFVENELGREAWDFGEGESSGLYEGYRLHSCGEGEILEKKAIDLWIWYSKTLPELKKEYAEDIKNSYIRDSSASLGIRRNTDYKRKFEHDYIENLKDEKLRELIHIRRGLWT